jgi:hypothetical protein
MRNVIGIISFTLYFALSFTKADSVTLTSDPIEDGIVSAQRAAGMQWLESRSGMPSARMLPLSFFDKGVPTFIVPGNSAAYLFSSTLSFAASYPVQRLNEGRRLAVNHRGSTHYARGGVEDFASRMYRLFFETRIRERKRPWPSN